MTRTELKTAAKIEATAKRICPKLSGISPAEVIAADKITRSLSAIARHPLVESVSDERGFGDGVWVYLKNGFLNEATDTGSIHEDTVAEILPLLRSAWFDIRETDEAEFAADREAVKAANAWNADLETANAAASRARHDREAPEAPAALHADSPRPADAEETRRAVIALAPAYSLALADGRPAAVELESRAADGLEPDFLSACAEEGNPVDTLAAHLADVKERAEAALDQAKQLARTHGTGRAAVDAARNAWQAVAVALNALTANPTPPPAPKPTRGEARAARRAEIAEYRAAEAAGTLPPATPPHEIPEVGGEPMTSAAPAPDAAAERNAKLDAQVSATFAETRAALALSDARSNAHAARYAYGFAVKDHGPSHPETRAACAAVAHAAAVERAAESIHAKAAATLRAELDAAAVERAYSSGAQDLPGGGDAWDVIAAEVSAEARRAEEATRTGATPAGTPAAALPLPGAPDAAHGPAPDGPATPSELG